MSKSKDKSTPFLGGNSEDQQRQPDKPRIWALMAPFRKTGWPVVGTFGATMRPVIIMETETWKRLCAEIPALANTEFEVGEAA